MDENHTRRQILLATAGVVSIGSVAGCSSSGNGTEQSGTGSPGETTPTQTSSGEASSPQTTTESATRTSTETATRTPTETATRTPTPTQTPPQTEKQTPVGGTDPASVSLAGPGGDAKLRIRLKKAGGPGISNFDQLTVFLKEMAFKTENGETATVSVGRLFDLTDGAYTSPAVSFPTGTYTEVTITMPVVRAVRSDGSDTKLPSQVKDTFTEDLEIVDDYFTVESGKTHTFILSPRPQKQNNGWGILNSFRYY